MVGDENASVFIDVDGETIERFNCFRYIEASTTNTDSCSEDIKENKYSKSQESLHVTGNNVLR